MSLADLKPLERSLLQSLYDSSSITVDLDNTLSIAQSFGTTTQRLAEAKNALRGYGYVEEQSDVFTGGAAVMRITPAGRALFSAPTAVPPATDTGSSVVSAPLASKPWWRFW